MSEQARKQPQQRRQSPSRGASAQRQQAKAAPAIDVTAEILSRARRDIAKMNYVTPAKLAAALNVNLSVARKVVRKLVEEGLLEVRAKNRRIIVAVPKSSS